MTIRAFVIAVVSMASAVTSLGTANAQEEVRVSLVPSSGPQGSAVRANGKGFLKSPCGVSVRLDSASGPELGSALVTEGGSFSVPFSIPAGTSRGQHLIVAEGLMAAGEGGCVSSEEEAEATFVVADRQIPFVSEPVTPFRFVGDLRDLPTKRRWVEGDPVRVGPGQEAEGEDEQGLSTPVKSAAGVASVAYADAPGGAPAGASAAQVAIGHGAALPAPIVNFEGIPNTGPLGVLPPDVAGDVGPSHYIEMVNATFAVFDKNGTMLAGPSDINLLWASFGGPCALFNDGDPDVRYDPMADRWVMTQFVAFTDFCIAVSMTADPLAGGWFLYDFSTGGIPNDYPKLAVWPDAYYMGSQRGYPFGSDAWAFDRAKMLGGAAATYVQFGDAGTFMLPSDLDGATLPPPGAPNVFMRHVDGAEFGGVDRLELREFHVDFAGVSTFTILPDIPTSSYDRSMCSLSLIDLCIPQPGTPSALESLTAWLMARLQYRNFGTHEALVVNHSVDADGANHAGIRWYELRKVGGAWSINQQDTFAPDEGAPGLADDVHRWMASAAMDRAGDLAIGYTISSATVFPSIWYTGRLVSDPPSTLPQGETVLVAGGGSQTFGVARWGDYSSLTVDPVDDCTFWLAAEYYQTTSTAGWQTRIGAFKFPTCSRPVVCDLPGPELVSRDGIVGNAASTAVAVNTDGRFVAFPSDATNLVVGDSNDMRDVFLRDRTNLTTERVSVGNMGEQANGPSNNRGGAPSVSGNGGLVAFYSDATNLVSSDTNRFADVFVRDRSAGTTERVSVGPGNAQGDGPSLYPSISENGRFVAFQSLASNLVPGDTNGFADIFVRDRMTQTTERVCDSVQGNGPSFTPSISPDGNFVAFASAATNLVAGDANRRVDVFVCNRTTGVIDRVSVSSAGVEGNGNSILPAISRDGAVVAFKSLASNLVPNDRNNLVDVFARDRVAGTTERISVSRGGGDADDVSFPPGISNDGRFVAFGSLATNLAAHDTNETSNVFVRDRQNSRTRFVDVNRTGELANRGTLDVAPAVAGDGGKIGFVSLASNLDGPDNEAPDVFIACNPFIASGSGAAARLHGPLARSRGRAARRRPHP